MFDQIFATILEVEILLAIGVGIVWLVAETINTIVIGYNFVMGNFEEDLEEMGYDNT